ncbi:MAG: hypothetical protein BWY90_01633 [Deltaproteobacteria bacterium ADurb.BinA014]|nr:MAG: hypothetical protein BWY90_01633 [Deltaproteobacteria bacterium ADurb.BinA014]
MQRSVLHLQIDFNNFLAVIPATAGIGHEDRLEKSEEGNCYQVADKEIRIEERKSQRHEENDDEDVNHSFLRVLCTNLNDFFGVFNRSFFFVQIDVLFDKHNRLISAGRDRLGGSAGKPVNDRATHNQAKDNFRLNQ